MEGIANLFYLALYLFELCCKEKKILIVLMLRWISERGTST